MDWVSGFYNVRPLTSLQEAKATSRTNIKCHIHSWYITEVVDQFLHLDSCSTFMGYIIVQPIFEVTRIVSTTVFLSATQALIYRELKDLIGKRHQRILFLLSKCSIFVIGLTSIYYLVLNFALAVAWMEFLSPSIIDDLANTRTLLEICLMAFFAFCTASMLLEVSWPCMRTFRRRHPLATVRSNAPFTLLLSTIREY